MHKCWHCWTIGFVSPSNTLQKGAWDGARKLVSLKNSKRLLYAAFILSSIFLAGCMPSEDLPRVTEVMADAKTPLDASSSPPKLPDNVQFGENGTPYTSNPTDLAEGIALHLLPEGHEGATTVSVGTMTFVRLDSDNIIDNELVIFVKDMVVEQPIYLDPSLFTAGKYETILTYALVLSDESLCYMEQSTIVEITAATDAIEVIAAILLAEEMSEDQKSIVSSRIASTH